MSDFVICYYIHDENNNIINSGFKKGSSAEKLKEWAEENNIDDYMIYLAMWEVERNYVKPLEEINATAQSLAQNIKRIDYLSDKENIK